MSPKPTVLIGGIGGVVADVIGLKLGWKFGCLCLDHRAILTDMNRQHPIFPGPHAVPEPATRTIPAPANFLDFATVKAVPETITVADIHAEQQAIAGAPVEALRLQQSREVLHTELGMLDHPGIGDPVEIPRVHLRPGRARSCLRRAARSAEARRRCAAVTASGTGCAAALDAERFIASFLEL